MKSAVLLFSLVTLSFSIPNDFYQNQREGYYFYKDGNIEKNTSKPLKPKIPKDLTKLHPKEFEKLLEEVKGYAVMNPSQENLQNYIKLQNFAVSQSTKFQKAWKDTILENPSLNIALNNPNSTFSRKVLTEEAEKKRKLFFEQYGSNIGLAVFVKNIQDERAKATKVLMDSIKSQYGLAYYFIPTDEKKDFAMSKGVKVLPDIFMVYKPTNGSQAALWIRVATGLVTEPEILDNIEHVSKRQLGILEQE